MRLSHFITISSLILCGWLSLTFFSEVPAQSYPKMEKYVRQDHAMPLEDGDLVAATGAELEISRVSLSH